MGSRRGGILILTCSATITAGMGMYQLQRRDEKIALLERIVDLRLEPVSLSDDTEYRRVSLSGSYCEIDGSAVRIGPRTVERLGRGYEIVLPFQADTGEVILVNRGWAPSDYKPSIQTNGTVHLTGVFTRGKKTPFMFSTESIVKSKDRVMGWTDPELIHEVYFPGTYPKHHQVLKAVAAWGDDSLSDLQILENTEDLIRQRVMPWKHSIHAGTWFSFSAMLVSMTAFWARLRKRYAMVNTDGPSESRISSTWDFCLESALLNTSLGVVVGGLSSVVVLRSPTGRAFMMGFGGGIGAGVAWMDCRQAFRSGVVYSPRLALPSLSTFSQFTELEPESTETVDVKEQENE